MLWTVVVRLTALMAKLKIVMISKTPESGLCTPTTKSARVLSNCQLLHAFPEEDKSTAGSYEKLLKHETLHAAILWVLDTDQKAHQT